MIFTLLITAAPYMQQCAHTAYQFSKALLAKGHCIKQIFFHQDGIHNADQTISTPTNTINLVEAWQNLAIEHNLDLVICVNSATQRQLLDEHHNKTEKVAYRFRISGLGQFMEAIINSDRVITFN